jgi:hypothetical protein
MPLAFDALIRAHGFMRTERPPEIWEADTEDVRFLPLLGEMIAAGLVGGAELADLTLNVSNVSNVVWLVDEAPDDTGVREPSEPARPTDPPTGEFVAVTVRGRADLGPDQVWLPGQPPQAEPALLLARLDRRLRDAGARYAYVRRTAPEGSVTVFLARSHVEADL